LARLSDTRRRAFHYDQEEIVRDQSRSDCASKALSVCNSMLHSRQNLPRWQPTGIAPFQVAAGRIPAHADGLLYAVPPSGPDALLRKFLAPPRAGVADPTGFCPSRAYLSVSSGFRSRGVALAGARDAAQG
jgi:hypothetical protein